MKVTADKKNFKNSYKKHYYTYKTLDDKNSSKFSRQLLLFYSVECGLKCKLLEKWKLNSPKEIFENKNDERNRSIGSHNIKIIIKELGCEGRFSFSHFKTIHKDYISIESYHQVCRYGIKIDDKDKKVYDKFEIELRKIAEWLEEEI